MIKLNFLFKKTQSAVSLKRQALFCLKTAGYRLIVTGFIVPVSFNSLYADSLPERVFHDCRIPLFYVDDPPFKLLVCRLRLLAVSHFGQVCVHPFLKQRAWLNSVMLFKKCVKIIIFLLSYLQRFCFCFCCNLHSGLSKHPG